MAVIGIDHVQLAMPCGEEAAARSFYRDVLGLTEVSKPSDLAKRGGCWFTNEPFGGSAHIHLGTEEPFVPAQKAHPALLVDDLAAMREVLKDAGVKFTEGTPLNGYERGDISDPFGNRIELMQRV